MDKKAVFFRKIVANSIIGAVLVGVFAFSLVGAVKAVGTDNEPIYRGASRDKVALMVNVYWGTECIDDMLAAFDKYGYKTTFFVGGSWAKENEAMLRKIYEKGHELGNHGYFHKDHDKIDAARNREEISATHNLVKSITGCEMTLFAPPSGAYNKTTLTIAEEQGYTTVMWTRDTIDWRDRDAAKIKKRAVKNASGGDLILMHPTSATVEALEGILAELKDKGLTAAKVSEVLAG